MTEPHPVRDLIGRYKRGELTGDEFHEAFIAATADIDDTGVVAHTPSALMQEPGWLDDEEV